MACACDLSTATLRYNPPSYLTLTVGQRNSLNISYSLSHSHTDLQRNSLNISYREGVVSWSLSLSHTLLCRTQKTINNFLSFQCARSIKKKIWKKRRLYCTLPQSTHQGKKKCLLLETCQRLWSNTERDFLLWWARTCPLSTVHLTNTSRYAPLFCAKNMCSLLTNCLFWCCVYSLSVTSELLASPSTPPMP